eukprot:107987-Alexandrium_andersonii.AAC.1
MLKHSVLLKRWTSVATGAFCIEGMLAYPKCATHGAFEEQRDFKAEHSSGCCAHVRTQARPRLAHAPAQKA